MTLDEYKAAADAELIALKDRAEAAEARAEDAQKKLQAAVDSEASLLSWFDSHVAATKAILPSQ